jgi:D-glycero-D-manno-heptose 1,7-bisphosphate phosphatase
MSGARGAVFLDRDGVLNVNLDAHVRAWDEFRFIDGALAAVRRLHEAGWPIVVVTNQSAIGRGLTSAQAVDEIHARMRAAIAEAGGAVARVEHCPHHPDDDCQCRKPKPAMLERGAAALGADLAASYFVGDHLTDVEAALAAGCRPVLVRTGRGASVEAAAAARWPELPIVDDLGAAVDLILGARRA